MEAVRVLIRYDVENISEETYKKALYTVFSEPPVDDIYEETFDYGDAKVFTVEFYRDNLTRELIQPSSV